MNQQVTDYIGKLTQAWQVETCNRLREIAYEVIPDVEERLQYGKPHYLKNKTYACVVSVAKAAVSFTIFNANEINAPAELFEGPPERKTIKIREGQAVDYALLGTLLRQAVATL